MGIKILTGVEVFSEGVWNGNTFDAADLDAICTSFDALGLSGRVPLRLGHPKRDSDGALIDAQDQLALGWVTRVYHEGKKLLCDWEIPDRVAALIDDGHLRHVSVELLKDVQAGTRVLPWVLDAVALLGSDQPAVGILRDLKKSLSTMSLDATTLSHAGRVECSRDDQQTTINFTGVTSVMSENVTALAEKIAAMQVQLNAVLEENARVKGENTTLKGVQSQLTALQTTVKQTEVRTHRARLTELLEAAVKSEDIQPAKREAFGRVYGLEDDDQVMQVTAEDVTSFIKDNPNPYKKKAASKIVSLTRATDDVPAGTSVEDEMRLRVEAALRESGVKEPTSDDWQRESIRLFKQNPDLASRYRTSVNVAISHPSASRQ